MVVLSQEESQYLSHPPPQKTRRHNADGYGFGDDDPYPKGIAPVRVPDLDTLLLVDQATPVTVLPWFERDGWL